MSKSLIERAALTLLRQEFFKDLERLREKDLLIREKFKKELAIKKSLS